MRKGNRGEREHQEALLNAELLFIKTCFGSSIKRGGNCLDESSYLYNSKGSKNNENIEKPISV